MTLTAGRVALGATAFAVPLAATTALTQLDPSGPGEQVEKPAFAWSMIAGLGGLGVGWSIHDATRFQAAGNVVRLAGAGALVGSFVGAELNGTG